MNFEGQTALVTGAASKRGIGREIARQISQGGGTVIIADINQEMLENAVKDIDQEKGSAYSAVLDVTSEEKVKQSLDELIGKFSKIDILVNNAGITRPTGVLDISEEEWDLIFDVNMKGTFFVTQHLLPHMKENNYGRIVNLSSVSGKRGGGIFGGSHYSAAKAAVTGFSKAVAREMASFGITSNTVAPGLIATDITGGMLTDEKKKQLENDIPAKRAGTVEDVANAVAFLATKESSYITGEEIDINGGSHID
ncbi:SDR family NAD(P)-dependent oxidoreductase [Salibacterium lacus]|uniref:SDR family NAD(P)-dependent oxidoreductase n=1 Tax=Salibacterium lacus TaxID=1898109 RepID=A0ABW5T222_9BACI